MKERNRKQLLNYKYRFCCTTCYPFLTNRSPSASFFNSDDPFFVFVTVAPLTSNGPEVQTNDNRTVTLLGSSSSAKIICQLFYRTFHFPYAHKLSSAAVVRHSSQTIKCLIRSVSKQLSSHLPAFSFLSLNLYFTSATLKCIMIFSPEFPMYKSSNRLNYY